MYLDSENLFFGNMAKYRINSFSFEFLNSNIALICSNFSQIGSYGLPVTHSGGKERGTRNSYFSPIEVVIRVNVFFFRGPQTAAHELGHSIEKMQSRRLFRSQ